MADTLLTSGFKPDPVDYGWIPGWFPGTGMNPDTALKSSGSYAKVPGLGYLPTTGAADDARVRAANSGYTPVQGASAAQGTNGAAASAQTAPTGGGQSGAATSLLTGGQTQAANVAPGGGVSGSLLTAASGNSYLPSLSGDTLKSLTTDPNARYTDPNTGWIYYGNWSGATQGNDENAAMGPQFMGSIVGHHANAGVGEPMALYDNTGAFSGSGVTGHIRDFGDILGPLLTSVVLGMGAQAAFGAVGAGTGAGSTVGPDFATGFTDTGTAGGVAADSYAGSGALTGPGGVVAPGGSSLLTGPTAVNADYSLLTGNAGPDFVPLEGNAGQGVNFAGNSGTGLQFNTSPNVESMGGAQGLTTTGAQTLGDPNSFINAAENQLPGAANQVVTQDGTFTDYTPSLGDPNSPINGGTNPWPGTVTPPGGNFLDTLKGFIPDDLKQVLPILQTITMLDNLLKPPAGTDPGSPSTYTPPQPEIGAGGSASGSAQGGASGSMAGVAGTLLTAKDTFGYGKSMLG